MLHCGLEILHRLLSALVGSLLLAVRDVPRPSPLCVRFYYLSASISIRVTSLLVSFDGLPAQPKSKAKQQTDQHGENAGLAN